jgi:hypothetical protein
MNNENENQNQNVVNSTIQNTSESTATQNASEPTTVQNATGQEVNNVNRTPAELIQQNGANYIETGSVPGHVDTSSLDEEKKSNPLVKVLLVIILILFGIWAFIVYTDYSRVREQKDPKYCFWKEETKEFENGTIESCKGLGYKVVNYEKLSDNGSEKVYEFIPIWVKTKTLDEI